jgi:hypothetical protein
MQRAAINVMWWLRLGQRWLKRNLSTCAGILAFLGGLCLGTLLRLAWVVLLLRVGPPSDQIALSAWAFALGLGVLCLGGFWVAFFLFVPHQRFVPGSTPSRSSITGIVLANAIYVIVALSIGDWLIH